MGTSTHNNTGTTVNYAAELQYMGIEDSALSQAQQERIYNDAVQAATEYSWGRWYDMTMTEDEAARAAAWATYDDIQAGA